MKTMFCCLLLLTTAVLTGCKGDFHMPFFSPKADVESEAPEKETVVKPVEAVDAPDTEFRVVPYPGESPVADDLDILVRQQNDRLVLINRTATTYSGMEVWVNQEYVAHISEIPVGGRAHVLFSHLVNRHGETYPTPGFLTPDRWFPVHLAELYDADLNRRYRLLVAR